MGVVGSVAAIGSDGLRRAAKWTRMTGYRMRLELVPTDRSSG